MDGWFTNSVFQSLGHQCLLRELLLLEVHYLFQAVSWEIVCLCNLLPYRLLVWRKKVGDIEGDVPSAKRSRRSSSDALQDMFNSDKLPLYGLAPNSTETSQKTFSFSVSDSLINVGPLKDFAYGLRINADLKATGIVKQSNYELMCCSGHGKNGALCILQQSIRPEGITEVELPGCKRIWTVYHKNTRGHNADSIKMVMQR